MHFSHHTGKHRAVTHTGIEHAHRRGLGLEVAEFHSNTPRDHHLLAAGVDGTVDIFAGCRRSEVARWGVFAWRPIGSAFSGTRPPHG